MSESEAELTAEQTKKEVLALSPTAVYWPLQIWEPTSESHKFGKFVKLIDVEHGEIDLSSASDEEIADYREYCRKQESRPPDATWHFIVLPERADRLHESSGHVPSWGIEQLSVSEAQSVSLGYSSVSEDKAWREAWGGLKHSENMGEMTAILVITVVGIGSALFQFWGYRP
jgi:hypothetical protein